MNALRMDDETWRRHANPWSVFTRFLAIPAAILAIWSRVWIGWWAVVPVAGVIIWLWLNPRVFSPVSAASSWSARGIYGEQLWLENRSAIPPRDRKVLNVLIVLGLLGFVFIAWGLVVLDVWPTVVGAVLLVLAQLWRLDRMGLLYERYAAGGANQAPGLPGT